MGKKITLTEEQLIDLIERTAKKAINEDNEFVTGLERLYGGETLKTDDGYEVYFADNYVELIQDDHIVAQYEYPASEGDSAPEMDEDVENNGVYWDSQYLEFYSNGKVITTLHFSDEEEVFEGDDKPMVKPRVRPRVRPEKNPSDDDMSNKPFHGLHGKPQRPRVRPEKNPVYENKKVIKITESDIERLVDKVIKEEAGQITGMGGFNPNDDKKIAPLKFGGNPERVRLISMDDPHTNLKAGDEGTVQFTDDTGTVHVSWDNGSTLGLIPDVDQWENI